MHAPVRDSVFISYSHRDRAWLEWMLIFLKPFRLDLTIWSDENIEAGDLWRGEIDAGLQRAAVGLLLVSPHFLASDFIMGEELPALVDAARENVLKLIWVPVSASHWKHGPLKDYQAAWDPDQPLDSLAEHLRNAALVHITERVVKAAKSGATTASTSTAVSRRDERPVSAAGPGGENHGRPGKPHDVPALPPHFLPRTEDLDHLRHSLLEGAAGAMGITGEPYRMGLHGQGGIGKTVLAAALACDEAVLRAFPDGVFWVTVGQSPDVPRLQSALLEEAGEASATVTDPRRGRKLLEERFGDSAVLLVLDDVWDHRHALEFDVLGPASRLLLTTRDAAVLTAIGAEREIVSRLPEGAALSLLATWAGCSGVALPEAAHGVVRECGFLPLALALAGARVRDGTPWDVVLKALEQGRLEFLDHPYRSVFGSLRPSVDALPPDERQRYLELAVFPEDTRVPDSVVLALWKQTAGLDELAGQDLLARLGNRALLEIAHADGRREVAFHDLQHDFLRISVSDVPALHRELLAALAAELPSADQGRQWWRLPSGAKYAWLHLARHLIAAERADELRGLLFDCRWLEAKLRVSGLPAVLADFAALPHDEELALVAGALRVSGHVLGGDPAQLRSQLTGRLLGIDRPRIRTMLHRAVTAGGEPWLRPCAPSLVPPTGSLRRTLTGHTEKINAVAVTADGRRAVSGSADETVKVWDLETGVEVRTLTGHTWTVTAVAVTEDGRRAVTGSYDRTLRVWDLETGAEVHTLQGQVAGMTAIKVAVTADGRRAVSSSDDGTVKVWNLATGTEERTLAGHTDRVAAVAVTADGRIAVTGSHDTTVKVWNLETGAEVRTLTGHSSAVKAVAVAVDGRRAVSGSDDGTVKVWDLETDAVRTLMSHPDLRVGALAMTGDGRRAIVGWGQTLNVWDVETGVEVRTLEGHGNWVRAVAITADGRVVVSGSDDWTLKVWDIEAGADVHTLVGHRDRVLAVAVTADGLHAISIAADTLKVWDVNTGAELRSLPGPGWVTEAAVAADGRRAVSGTLGSTLQVWDADTGTVVRTLAGRTGWPYGMAITADGRRVVSGSYDGSMQVWEVEAGDEVRTLAGSAGRVTSVALTADGRRAVSGASDRAVKVWDLESGTEVRTVEGNVGEVSTVAVTADGRRIVWVTHEGTLKVWDTDAGVEVRTLATRMGGVNVVAVTADGRRAVSGAEDGTLKIWEVESGRILVTFAADGPLRCCAITPDAMRIVAGDDLGSLHFLLLQGLPS